MPLQVAPRDCRRHRLPQRPALDLSMSMLADSRASTAPQAIVLPLWLGYCAFVVYGSLVPLEFKPLALSDAWRTFQHMPVLEIGAEHRADWISNIVLYVPVG